MRVSRPKTKLLFSLFLLIFFSITIIARADDDEADDYDVKARVVRVSLISGEANLKRNGNKDWEPIRLNYPLVEGDTVATGKDSRLEMQMDARNFVRLAASSVVRIVTLRDEGVAMSVVEGTATVRLAKFDHDHEYFEIDAPKTTMAAEKKGLYRIDVTSEGRVHLTVRDGGTARIYSDTAGFTLRDNRSAELVVNGENAGDWDFFAAAPNDAIDDWVNEREQYLAQRLKYDVKYFDEYVWGAEDLDAYGDWIQNDEYGWIWRPHSGAIASYSDWAPYRYGNWEWCPPYGWTWIGYEPWGWAPYHYGRWIYINNYWAWCPRSRFYHNRSWWRPALVAFVSLNFSFGNDICWYPLSYYQRDPHSHNYRHGDRRPGYGSPRDGQTNYGHEKTWRGVTRVPRTAFGNTERRGEPVNEQVARRVLDSDPERADLPRKNSLMRAPVIQIPDRPTGAGDRTPGVALDEDLRRSRVFHGREPRPEQPPSEPRRTDAGAPTDTNTPTAEPEARPAGAVSRPEPAPAREPRSDDGRGRMVRPVTSPDGSEKRGRGREAIESTPRNAPEPRREQPAPVAEPAPASPPPPREAPKVDRGEMRTPRYEPRSEPRSESPRSESPRSESPRSAPDNPKKPDNPNR